MELSGLEVLDPTKQKIRLDSLWKEQPLVLVFLRHFG
jgi:hypothetical protein